jgi:serine/threonine protein phosphatase 1
MVLSRFFRKATVAAPRAPDDAIVYAIGDIHGRLDCLESLLRQIADEPVPAGRRREMVFLGDLIDRGPDSRGVVERVMTMAATSPDVHCLSGNHEELLLRAAEGNRQALGVFARVGGRETLLSYGVDADDYDRCDLDGMHQLILDHVPVEQRDFLRDLPDYRVVGDYLMVHAGIRPGVALAEQKPSDLRWIRAPFLDHGGRFDHFVIHGHTVTEGPDIRSNRIGIDTGAYMSGQLTALVLDGADRRFLTTVAPRA